MRKIEQDKIPVRLLKGDVMEIAVEQGVIEDGYNWKLVREHDGLVNQSKAVKWLEWNEEGRFKAEHDQPAVGYSLIMSPFNQFFTWQTTSITEIVASSEDGSYLKFKTQNSTYELWRKD